MTYKIYKKKNNKNDKAKITKNIVFQYKVDYPHLFP